MHTKSESGECEGGESGTDKEESAQDKEQSGSGTLARR